MTVPQSMPAYQHVIFDFDGTLVDSAPAILGTFTSILEAACIPPAVSLGPDLIGPPLIATLKKISGSDDDVLIEHLAARFKDEYDNHKLSLTAAYAGASEALDELQQRGLSLHVATNKRERPTLRLLDLLDWRRFFASVYCIDTPPEGSPGKPEMIARLVNELRISPAAAVFVGDTVSDYRAAHLNGMDFLAVTWGYGNWANENPAANWMETDSFAQIVALVSPPSVAQPGQAA